MASLTLAFFVIQYFLINEGISVSAYSFLSLRKKFFKLSCLFNNFAFKCLLEVQTCTKQITHFFSLIFFCKVIWRKGCGWEGMHCTNLVWTLYINIHVRGIFVSCFLKLITNCTLLVICLTCYVDIITSTKGYKNHTLEPLTKKLNKQIHSLQKQCSFCSFLIGTGNDPCFR